LQEHFKNCVHFTLKEIAMKKVQYEEMLPHELEEAIGEFPVAYVPVGSLEWHGRHLALGAESAGIVGKSEWISLEA